MTAEPSAPGEIPERRLLARDASLVERIRVYRRGEALEVDTSSFYRITRHRVLFEEVELATLHRGRNYRAVLALGLLGLLAGSIFAAFSTGSAGTIAFGIMASTVVATVLGYLLPDWVISIQSRRTWTRMRFGPRHGKAQRVFDQLIAAIRTTQNRIAADRPAASAPRSPFAPPPAEDFPAAPAPAGEPEDLEPRSPAASD